MWLVPTKKELNKELEKIKIGFTERDKVINELKQKIENNSLKIATLEGAYSLMSQKSQTAVSTSVNKSRNKIETKLLKRISQNKKSMVMTEVIKLLNDHSVQETYQIVVVEKGLCSKASYYRYVNSLKNQELITTGSIKTI